MTAGRVAQALLGTLAVGLLALIALQVSGPATAVVGGLIGAVYPPWLALDASLFSEPLFIVFEVGAVAAALRARNSDHGLRWIIASGVLAGLGALTRPNGLVLLLPLALLAWTVRPARWGRVAAIAVLVGSAVLTVAALAGAFR